VKKLSSLIIPTSSLRCSLHRMGLM